MTMASVKTKAQCCSLMIFTGFTISVELTLPYQVPARSAFYRYSLIRWNVLEPNQN
jgi:hypothetical protein